MKQFTLELEFGGLVLFDPETLVDFLATEKIGTSQVFDYLLKHEEQGWKAIEQGVVAPIYPVSPGDYHIVMARTEEPVLKYLDTHFIDRRYGLDCRSGIVIISDIYAIMEWDDADFFCDYKARYAQRSQHNEFFETGRGYFWITISGGMLAGDVRGYNFVFEQKTSLPVWDRAAEIDDVNYDLGT